MSCIAKGGIFKNTTKWSTDLYDKPDEATLALIEREPTLKCACREGGALLQLALYKLTANTNLPSGCPPPPWHLKRSFSRAEELAFTEILVHQTSGLTPEQLLQPSAHRLKETALWALKGLQGSGAADETTSRELEEMLERLKGIELA